MTKKDLISAMAEKTGLTKRDLGISVDAFLECVTEAMKNQDPVKLTGFGMFEGIEKAARTGKNPKTGEPIMIPAKLAPKFKAGKALKDALNN